METKLDRLKDVLAIDSLSAPAFVAECRAELEAKGALVVKGFFSAAAIEAVVRQSEAAESEAYYARSSHNVYLTPPDASLDDNHPFNRQVVSSKGLIADDQIPKQSPLRTVYDSPEFREFLCAVLDIPEVHPYADSLSSVNVHFAQHGKELGWHFDNSSFAVTMLLQAPESGGVFEYVANVRDADSGEMGFEQVAAILDGEEPVSQLKFSPGDLVLFRGRDSIHRVTPTIGDTTRMLVVFAYNSEPGVGLSESALGTFYGRTGHSV
jgi:hypothetical protein